ncbi:MAG TPA: response regulator transcription factor [Niastella sp.]
MKKAVTIAVADDHPIMRQCTTFRLSMLGYKVVVEAENGKKLLDHLCGSIAPDICLLDINMPVMGGFETISHLKQNWPGMKVLFLSMHNETQYYDKAIALGADGFITKDAPFKELESALHTLMNKKKRTSQHKQLQLF